MNRILQSFILIVTWSAVATAYFLPWSRIVPTVRISDSNQVVVSWETMNPTSKAVVFFGADDGTNRQPFPAYISRATERHIGKTHAIILKGVETYTLYNFRVSCVDTTNLTEIRSTNYTFRVVRNGDQLAVGLALTEGPIVANVTTTSAVIAWRSNLPCKGHVQYWVEGENSERRTLLPTVQAKFEVALGGLTPDKVYHYRVSLSSEAEKEGTVSSTFSFRTAPEEKSKKSYKFAAYGDSRGGTEADADNRLNGVSYLIVNKLANAAWKKGAEFFLQTGDLADGNTEDREDMGLQYATHKKAIAQPNAFIPFYQAMGNHDTRGPHIKFGKRGSYDPPPPHSAEDLWAETFVLPDNGPQPEPNHPPFSENVYSFDYGSAHFISLNSEYFIVNQDDSIRSPYRGFGNRVAGNQLEWLKEDLKKSAGKLLFVYLHDPFYPAGGHVGSSLDKYPGERDSLWRLLESHNVALVFAGHEHFYARVRIDKTLNPTYKKSTYQITTGGAGAPTYAQDKKIPYLNNVVVFRRMYHYVLVTVEGKKWKAEVYDDNDEKIDEFTP